MAFLTGTWTLAQQNGGPAILSMTVADNGEISLALDGTALPGYTGTAIASGPNTDGQYPVIMTIYSTTTDDGMGLSITNYLGAVKSFDVGPQGNIHVREMVGTATGTSDYSPDLPNGSPIEVFSWAAQNVTE